jgi:hypothetical protein
MPPPCSVCAHPRHEDLHRTLEAGGGVNATARDFGLNPSTLKLHLKHRPVKLTGQGSGPAGELTGQRPDEPPADEGELPLGDLEGRLRQLVRTADGLRRDAEASDLPVRERAAALGQCRQTTAAAIDLHLELQEGRELALLQSPEWVALRARVLELLLPFPEARAALLEGLRAA